MRAPAVLTSQSNWHGIGELASARARGANLLHLLTSASRDGPEVSDGYSGTRLFYETMGFFPTRELRLEGWSDEALLLVRPLA